MKKILSSVLVCVLLLSTVFVLASCAKQLNGTYEGDYATFEFKGEEVSVTISGISIAGTYTIEDGKITFEFDNVAALLFDGEHDYSDGTKDGKHYIEIDGVEYIKK